MLARRCARLLTDALSSRTRPPAPPCRAFSSSHTLLKQGRQEPRNAARNLRNEEIDLRSVYVVNAETTKLGPRTPLHAVLAGVNRSTHFVELVSRDPPVVKIVDSKAAHAARKALKARLRATRMEQKEVQMTWNVGAEDIAHKLRNARAQLVRGNMVDVAFAPKSKQPLPPRDEMRRKMQQVVDFVQDIAVEKQERTLLRNVGVVSLRPVKTKIQQEAESTENAVEFTEDAAKSE
ncbi:hypothetical protein DFH11DRAFT_323502 [Phellopilus nigrolimitatus]|nr:hypothetical protein DFH11DRAFT_323502 [Phellopilus nigrolimitatus]